MPRCEICSFELAGVGTRCPNCGAAAGGGDSTLVNSDFNPAELLRAAAQAARDDDDAATAVANAPAESTRAYESGSDEAAFVQELMMNFSVDTSGDSTSVYPAGITQPSDKTAEDAPALARTSDALAAAGFPDIDDDFDEDDLSTGNIPPATIPTNVADDATIQEQNLADFLDDDMRAAISKLKAGEDNDRTAEVHTMARGGNASGQDDVDDGATQELQRDQLLSFAQKPPQDLDDGGDATVEITSFRPQQFQPRQPLPLPPKLTVPTKLPPIPLPTNPRVESPKVTQPTQIPPRPTQPSMIPTQAPQHFGQPHGSQFAPQPQGSQFVQQPQGSQFMQQPQGSQFMQQPQGSQFMQQPQGSQFMPQPQGFGQQPQPYNQGFPQPPPAQPPQPAQPQFLGLPPKMLAMLVALIAVIVIAIVVVAVVMLG